jgi:hypothetical protein
MARPPTAQPMAQPMALPMALPMAQQTAPARKWRLHNAAQFSLDADKLMMQWFMQKLLLAKNISFAGDLRRRICSVRWSCPRQSIQDIICCI